MNEAKARKKVLAAIREVAPEADLEEIDPHRNFRDQIELDSLDFLNFVLRLEQSFRRAIPESDYPKLSSLNGCAGYFAAGSPASSA